MPNAEWFRERWNNDPRWRKEKMQKNAEWQRKQYKKLQKKRGEVFGDKCKICKSKIRLCLHRRDGKSHGKENYLTCLKRAIENPEEWIRLCGKCHDGIHWVMKYFHLSWKEIESRLRELRR